MISALVVDDAGIMRIVLRSILVNICNVADADISEAGNGFEAIEIYRVKKPDFVFLDISMPELDGLGTVKKLMEIDPSANIIMCTASNDEEDVRECIAAGAIDYILKPPKPDRVVKAIEKVLKTGTSSGESDARAAKNEDDAAPERKEHC